jgi:hypothetical protein
LGGRKGLTRRLLWVASGALLSAVIGCPQATPEGASAPVEEGPPAPASAPHTAAASAPTDPLARLYDLEQALRRSIADGERPPGPGGADPSALAALDDGGVLLTLSATSELVRLDSEARELTRVASAAGARDVATWQGEAYVVGGRDGRLLRHPLAGEGRAGISLGAGVALLDDLAAPSTVSVATRRDRACVVVADDPAGELVVVPADAPPSVRAQRVPVGPRLIGADAFGDLVVARSLIDHTAVVFRADAACVLTELGRVTHDGPLYAATAFTDVDGAVQLIVAGVEDRPLDRSDGFFGDLDTAVVAYALRGASFVRRWAVNVGELGLVNVKRLLLEGPPRAPRAVLALSAGSAAVVRLGVATGEATPATPLLPVGDAVLTRGKWLWTTSPLTDALTLFRVHQLDHTARTFIPQGGPPRAPLVALGEALALTSLMAQRPRADGQHSQVSCESCHHALSVDGRTHFTGRTRDDERVVATTRTLFGLLQARPHFSRALDKTSTIMIDNEFGVMAAGTDGDARFDLILAEHPWLGLLGLKRGATIDAVTLREALMRFLASARPPPAPATRARRQQGDARLSSLEARGADVFAARCARCHAPRVLLDEEDTAVPRAQWGAHLLGDRPSLVWARDGYERTGVTPYVHDDGARPSPLFGLWLKRPLLTTGEAATLEQLLDAVRDRPGAFQHRPPPGDDGVGTLPADERKALLAFLQLL